MKRLLIVALLALGFVGSAQASSGSIYASVLNPSGGWCGNSCDFTVYDHTTGITERVVSPISVSFTTIRLRDYACGGCDAGWESFYYNILTTYNNFNHDYQAWARYKCPVGGGYRFSESKSFYTTSTWPNNWTLGTFHTSYGSGCQTEAP